jgi:hypothetical protein
MGGTCVSRCLSGYHPGMLDESTDSSNATERDRHRWLLPALAIASLRDDVPERRMLTAWLDSWFGAR